MLRPSTSSLPRARYCRRHPLRALRRAVSIPANGQEGGGDPSILLREVMRNVAQPVAIAVTSVPSSSPLHSKAKYHGATLTSFTSLTLHPYPLVAFSLRLPSRMADCLRPWRVNAHERERGEAEGEAKPAAGARARLVSTEARAAAVAGTGGMRLPPKSELPWPLSALPMPEDPPPWAQELFSRIPNPTTTTSPLSPSPSSSSSSSSPLTGPSGSTSTSTKASPAIPTPPTPLTISLLSTLNEEIADQLSQPRTDHSSIFSQSGVWNSDSDDLPGPGGAGGGGQHPPSLKDCVGSLRCQVVGSVRLKDLCEDAATRAITQTTTESRQITNQSTSTSVKGEGSEMFICRVVGVEMGDENLEPLLHWRRKYAGVKLDNDEASGV
ncbi:hypothetical protein CI109_105605 [Kwoniella shandongensis]|uniref:Uncharacterized protein n=1 Tax=Kwoniella shandongensis TaxID=1734106 RepID=A0A5M6C892_9TREE|nr:uncharacterized protein CI109_002322 [Kwoniella shandongensis]KAA5529429.1 hypothetical protein CI109_002322 [Kwoniella shandongensis]